VAELLLAIAVVAVALARETKIAAFRAIVVAVTFAGAIGMLEATAALHLLHWKLVLEHVFGEDANMAWDYDPDPALGWKRRPNDKWTSPSISDIEGGYSMRAQRRLALTFTYDGYGYRNPRTVPRADVVLIGDSYIEGANAEEIYVTLVREKLVSTLEHAAYVGCELMKAEIAMKKNLPYVQDDPLP